MLMYICATLSLLGHLCRTPGAPIDDRIKDLLGRMNQDEKIAQMASVKHNSLCSTRGGLRSAVPLA